VLKGNSEYTLWQKIACNRFTCTVKNCEFYQECAFFKARKKIARADVIIGDLFAKPCGLTDTTFNKFSVGAQRKM
jgi:hypothetical protein